MHSLEYKLMGTDFVGHVYEQTYVRSVPEDLFDQSQSAKCKAFIDTIEYSVRPEIRAAAPWVCAKCHRPGNELATRVLISIPKDPLCPVESY